MHLHMPDLKPSDRYKLLTGLVVPRPIAWITTLGADGSVNAAPYSFFNVMGSDPPVIAVAPGDRPEGGPKDTAANIRRDGVFVVNLVPHDLIDEMNLTATDFPPGEDELAAIGVGTVPMDGTAVPRIQGSPAAFACREHSTVRIGRNRIVLGEVEGLYIDDRLLDTERLFVNTPALDLVGRMGGRGGYVRTTDLLEVPRVTYAQWQAQQDPGAD